MANLTVGVPRSLRESVVVRFVQTVKIFQFMVLVFRAIPHHAFMTGEIYCLNLTTCVDF